MEMDKNTLNENAILDIQKDLRDALAMLESIVKTHYTENSFWSECSKEEKRKYFKYAWEEGETPPEEWKPITVRDRIIGYYKHTDEKAEIPEIKFGEKVVRERKEIHKSDGHALEDGTLIRLQKRRWETGSQYWERFYDSPDMVFIAESKRLMTPEGDCEYHRRKQEKQEK